MTQHDKTAPVRDEILRIITETLDTPTLIKPRENCKNLTHALMEIELILKRVENDKR